MEISSIRLLGHRLGPDLGRSGQRANEWLGEKTSMMVKSAELGQALASGFAFRSLEEAVQTFHHGIGQS